MKNSDKEKQTDNVTRNKSKPYVQDKPDDKRVKTVTPVNDNGKAGPAEGSLKICLLTLGSLFY